MRLFVRPFVRRVRVSHLLMGFLSIMSSNIGLESSASPQISEIMIRRSWYSNHDAYNDLEKRRVSHDLLPRKHHTTLASST